MLKTEAPKWYQPHMIKRFSTMWNDLFASREWEPYGDAKSRRWIMRRWREGAWEMREPTAVEREEAHWWQAIA